MRNRSKIPSKVTTLIEALELMHRDGQGRHNSWGVLRLRSNPPVIERIHYYEGSSGGDSTDIDEYEVTPEVARELKWYTEGKKHWGYTDEDERVINMAGTSKWWEIVEARKRAEPKSG